MSTRLRDNNDHKNIETVKNSSSGPISQFSSDDNVLHSRQEYLE